VTKLNYHKENFFKNTYCIFKTVDPEELTNKTPDFTSRSGSQYFYTEAGVYRISSHWGRAATCRWRLQTDANNFRNVTKVGFAEWSSFYKDNEIEKLYFIQKSEFTQKYEYYHKQESFYKTEYTLRTASETRKVLRQLKTITTETKWAKYIPHDDLDHLRNHLINGLLTTTKTLPELRRSYTESL
jgi:ribosomal protein S8